MRGVRPALALAVALSALSCAEAVPPPVTVSGTAAALTALAGEWRGEYWSAQSGRSGTIRFTLAGDPAGGASGEVVMMPAAHRATRDGGQPQPVARPLAIRFVAVDERDIRGNLEPYEDPDCGCMLSTFFRGDLRGDTIRGDFTTRGENGHPTQTGSWRVRRDRAGG
jgi:hypothetical protein